MGKYEGDGASSKLGGVIQQQDNTYILTADEEVSRIIMQHKSDQVNGFTIEDLLAIALDRLDGYNAAVPDPNNACAILGIQQAILHLGKREHNRHRAGVKGTDLIIPKRERPVIVNKGKNKTAKK